MIIIRQARESEIDILIQFQQFMAQETEDLSLNTEVVRKGVKAIFDDDTKGQYWVAESDGEVIGCLLVTYEWSEWRNGTILWIQSVYVTQTHREKGVYRSLYQRIKDEVAQNDELCGIRLYVEKDNDIAQKVYTSLGMDGDHYKLFEWMKD